VRGQPDVNGIRGGLATCPHKIYALKYVAVAVTYSFKRNIK